MNIQNVNNVYRVYGEQMRVNKKDTVDAPARIQKRDEVVLSSQAQGIGQVSQALKGVPDVRMDKVKEFSEKIAAGTYNISEHDVANKLFNFGKNVLGA